MGKGISPEFLSGGGEMGARMRAHDWSRTSLGPPETWPQSLRTVVRILLTSRYQMWMGWGEDLTFFYNDAYRPTLGIKHDWALGIPASTVWKEIWPDVGPRIERVLKTGEATWDEGLLLFLERSGYPEETYHTFSYSPLSDDSGQVVGMLCVVTEETDRVIGERRVASLRQLAAEMAGKNTPQAVLATAENILSANRKDLPFTLLYLFDEDGSARLAGGTGFESSHAIAPSLIRRDDQSVWPLREIAAHRAPMTLHDVGRFTDLPRGAWDKAAEQAAVVPITRQGQDALSGFLVAGINPCRRLDEDYRGFLSLVAGQIASALSNAYAYEEERSRAEALAAIDRAKTAFFSNTSHEFRTPLTLMLGPLADMLTRKPPQGPILADAAELETMHRNGVRLLKLVNTLLDFSRIEAGRVQARFEATDLAAYTGELASAFHSAMQKAGLDFVVDCQPLPENIFVDRGMWEKIVLNLLSNAFKYTLNGQVTVSVTQEDDGVRLTVRDTGVGIAAQELPRLFERFHRIEGQRGRTQEGTGIGLALVAELVRLHGGEVGAESVPGEGSAIFVTIPRGRAHLPSDLIEDEATGQSGAIAPGAFVSEALRWLPGEDSLSPDADLSLSRNARTQARASILLADDNSDMRDYVGRLLSAQYDVQVVGDGQAALEAVRLQRPDLVLSDVMMPQLDGFGLLRALRADENLRDIPIILLSARAGEEASVEGLNAGADDYLVKPFSARELLARVGANIALANLRREAFRVEQELRAEAQQARASLQNLNETLELQVQQRTLEVQNKEARLRTVFETSFIFQGALSPEGILLDANATSLAAIGAGLDAVVGRPFWDTPWFAGTPGMPDEVRAAIPHVAAGETVRREIRVNLPVGGWRSFDFQMRPVRDDGGAVVGIVPEAVELT